MSYEVEHSSTFGGYPVIDWKGGEDVFAGGTDVAVAVRSYWDEKLNSDDWLDKFNALMKHERIEQLPALVIGMWDYEQTVGYTVNALVENKSKLPNLKALFIGDVTSDEFEISWIKQDDLSPLWRTFPNLEYVTIRGAEGLSLGAMSMPKLKSLRIESGGLGAEVVRAVGEGNFPELETLVLWLGTSEYGATAKIADLAGFYECKGMPKLKYLGLCDSEIADEVAEFIATAPVLERLEVLDMSLGLLTDSGALALLTSPYIRKLKKLDLHYHYCSTAMVEKLKELEKDGVQVDASDQQTDHEWRFVAVGE